MKTKFKKFKIRSAKDFSRKFRNLCEKWLLAVFTQPRCIKALCLTCWVLPRSPGRRALGHLLSCEGGFFTEPWNTSKSLRSMKGFEISLTTPVSSSLQGTPCVWSSAEILLCTCQGVHNVRHFHFLVCTFVLESSFAQSHHCCLSHKNSPLAVLHIISRFIWRLTRPCAQPSCRQFSPCYKPTEQKMADTNQHSLLKNYEQEISTLHQ